MKKGFMFFVLAMFIVFLALSSALAGLPKKALKTLPLSSSVIAAPAPLWVAILLVKAPANGENWALGTKYDIAWTSSNISGYLRLDLYCDFPSPHKVGTITAKTSVSNGKYTWEAGKYLGGAVATHGKGYRIVFTATNPSISKSSPQFNLVVPSAQPRAVSTLPGAMKGLTFNYPRRGDGFYKGIRYTISWQSINLKDAKLKLELLSNQEQVLQTIADDFENTGKKDWVVPMSLPDEETFYKIRLQTMDGARKATVGPIKIFKGAALPASLKVTNPITSDKAFGDLIPVRWTSTAACSGEGGPLDAGFRIELMNEQETAKVMDLTDVGYVFDNEGPAGYLNWHWDWRVEAGSCQPGTYRIKVTGMIPREGCSDTSDKFRIMYAQERKSYEIVGKRKLCGFLHKCVHCSYSPPMSSWLPRFLHDDEIAGIGEYPLVGYHYVYSKNATIGEVGNTKRVDEFVLWLSVRSLVTFSDDPYWYKKMGSIQEAKLILKRIWKTQYATTQRPALAGVALETQSDGCKSGALNGKVPVNASQGDTFEIDVTAHYLALANKGKPDYGIILYPSADYSTTCNDDCLRRNAENYEVTLKARFIDNKR
jgi:hypothetical protein